MTNAELRKDWEIRVATFKSSGQSIRKWCVAQDVKEHQLRYWLQKVGSPKFNLLPSTSWASVEIDKQSETSRSLLLVNVGQVTIEVKAGFDTALLAEVVNTDMHENHL